MEGGTKELVHKILSFPQVSLSCSLRAWFNRRQFNFTAATFTSPISASFVALRASIFYFGKIKTSTIRGREKLIRTPTRLIELYRCIALIVAAVTRQIVELLRSKLRSFGARSKVDNEIFSRLSYKHEWIVRGKITIANN